MGKNKIELEAEIEKLQKEIENLRESVRLLSNKIDNKLNNTKLANEIEETVEKEVKSACQDEIRKWAEEIFDYKMTVKSMEIQDKLLVELTRRALNMPKPMRETNEPFWSNDEN